MGFFTRREILQFLSMIFPLSFLSCAKGDIFSDEHVCVHVFHHDITIPEPLLQPYQKIPDRNEFSKVFHVGIPELLFCTTEERFLNMFQYFWPITADEFQKMNAGISVLYSKLKIANIQDINDLSKYLKEHKSTRQSDDNSLAVIFTFNDFTKYFSRDLIALWQKSTIRELIIFKDPTRSPYLCDFPSLQKGFKRPPP